MVSAGITLAEEALHTDQEFTMRRALLLCLLAAPALTGCKFCQSKTGRICGDGPNDHDPSEQDVAPDTPIQAPPSAPEPEGIIA